MLIFATGFYIQYADAQCRGTNSVLNDFHLFRAHQHLNLSHSLASILQAVPSIGWDLPSIISGAHLRTMISGSDLTIMHKLIAEA